MPRGVTNPYTAYRGAFQVKQGVRSARLEGRNRSSEPSRTKHLSGTQRKLRLPMLRPVVVWSGATVDRLIRLAYLARVQAQGLNACATNLRGTRGNPRLVAQEKSSIESFER